jgi:predicted enzyme related to lactoylglutathione lyase
MWRRNQLMPNPVVHWEIGGREAAKLTRFYGQLFGWTIDTANPEYGLVEADDGGIGGGIMQVHGDVPQYVTIYVHVDDLKGTLARAESLGGETVKPPEPIPGVGSFALIRDPDGNVVGLLSD